jgi:heat shock protein HtpX
MTSALKTAALLGLLSALFLFLGQLFGGEGGLMIAFLFAVVMNIGSYWFSDKLVLRMYRAKEVGAGHPLYQLTSELVQRAQLPMPRVYVIPDESPNAFATGRNPQHAAVAATEGIMRILSRDELAGVMAHELAHVKHRDILISSVAATIAAAIMMVARMAQFASLFGSSSRSDDGEGSNPLALLVGIFVAPLAAMLIQAAISRSREFGADAGGAAIAGSPMGLASALRKIEAYSQRVPMDANPATAHMFIIKPFSVRGLFSLFSTHPPTEQRIAALMGRSV